jgi:hypothetical protein
MDATFVSSLRLEHFQQRTFAQAPYLVQYHQGSGSCAVGWAVVVSFGLRCTGCAVGGGAVGGGGVDGGVVLQDAEAVCQLSHFTRERRSIGLDAVLYR